MDTTFRCSARFLLRAPVLPRHRLRSASGVVDGLLREAVAVSSPALSTAVDKMLAGQVLSESAARALTRYELRMAGRPTPFGLLAGIAVGGFAEHTEAALDSAHRRHVHPDRGWLADWIDELEAEPEVLARLDVVANNLCARHGNRLTVPQGTRRASVRATAVVDRALRAAAGPIRAADLVDSVAEEFPGLPHSGIADLVARLVRLRFLQTTVRRSDDPFADLIKALPEESPHRQRIAVIAASIDAYQRTPIGAGTEELAAIRHATGTDTPVHVDLELDARVRLPHVVARELERAADAVWRLSAPDNARSRNLAAYHARFLERYGIGELVPVLDVLDPDVGIGPPAGYERPWTTRSTDEARQSVLNSLAMQAMADGVNEVELDDDLIARLSPPGGTPPATAELFTTVHAVSPDALARGEFELVVNPLTGTQQGGASLGRFAHLPEVRELLAELVAVRGDDRLPVQIAHDTTRPRDANVARAPRLLAHSLSIGVPGDNDELRLADLAVSADAHLLRLYSLGCEVVPRLLNVLNISATAPEAVRFLWDVSMMGVRTIKPWDWGTLRDAPFLPAIRYGRTVLAPARWHAAEDDLRTDAALAAWQARWRVPDRVRLTNLDQQLCLDLRVAQHRELLRNSGPAVLFEDRAPELDQGWLRGPDGAHEAELVAELIAVTPEVRATRPPAPLRTRSMAHPPGGEWVSAHIPCSPHRQREVLAEHLRPWLAGLESEMDRWFFLRYQADDQPPHLRLRLHGDVLPQLRTQLAALTEARLVGDFSLHTYHPEVERYGGEQLIGLAEQFFTADSRLALHRMSTTADPIAVAADLAAMMRQFQGDRWPSWLLAAFPKNEATHKAFTRRRADALAAITLDPVPADQDWADLLTEYGRARPHGDILRALLHMHCNRRLGPDFQAETEVYAIARGAVQAHVHRERATR